MVDKLHSYIREDLTSNQKDLLNLEHYYTHKYRSKDPRLDINVGMFINEDYKQVVQIYVADKHTRIREQMIMEGNKIVDTYTIIRRYE